MTRGDSESSEGGGKGQDEMALPSYFYDLPEPIESRWTSWLVPLFVMANVTVFFVAMFVNNCPADTDAGSTACIARFLHRFSFQPLRENPLLGPSASALEKVGAVKWEEVVHEHQGWRLISSVWLHAGIIHLLVDILCLIFVGIRLEQQFGFVRIGTIYVVSGIGGNLLSSLFITNGASVGGSGALFGLLGAMLSELITNWTLYTNKVAAILTLLLIVAINLAIGIFPLVNNFAHVGGFIVGFLLGFVLLIRPQFDWIEGQSHPKYKFYQRLLWMMGILMLITGFVIGMVLLFKGVNGSEHCHWCGYLNCVPTSKWSCGD